MGETNRGGPGSRLAALVLVITITFAAGCSASDDGRSPGSGSAAPATTVDAAPDARELSPLHVVAGTRPHFEDARGREVLLRGVNVIAWGDYFQADPALPAVVPVTDADWDAMAALGFSVVRLIVSWSSIEPERGRYDDAQIDRIRAAVEAAGRRGLYVVVDMHQDAWGKHIATPPGTVCPEGSEAAIGWDGAPAWATITDGASTCRVPGARELSNAVSTAFTNFYADRDGIRTALANAWGHLAGRLADLPAVAGYDLFNEPNAVGDLAVTRAGYAAFVNDSIAAIRRAEAAAGVVARIAFVEPLVLWPLPGTAPDRAALPDPQVAFAPHNYFDSITRVLTLEAGFSANTALAQQWGAPMWTGEYGWWDTDAGSMASLRRFAAAEDAAVAGGAWWQWRQACGDPHTLNNPTRSTSDQLHLNGVGCPGDRDRGLTDAFAQVISRAYPRAAPGTISSLRSDPDARTLDLQGTGAGPGKPELGPLVVWVPDRGRGAPRVSTTGVRELAVTAVPGGYLVTGRTDCWYRLTVDGPDATADPARPAC